MQPKRLTLATIRGRRVSGVALGPDGEPVPLYTTDAASPEATHYLVGALDGAIALLSEAREASGPELRKRIDEFTARV